MSPQDISKIENFERIENLFDDIISKCSNYYTQIFCDFLVAENDENRTFDNFDIVSMASDDRFRLHVSQFFKLFHVALLVLSFDMSRIEKNVGDEEIIKYCKGILVKEGYFSEGAISGGIALYSKGLVSDQERIRSAFSNYHTSHGWEKVKNESKGHDAYVEICKDLLAGFANADERLQTRLREYLGYNGFYFTSSDLMLETIYKIFDQDGCVKTLASDEIDRISANISQKVESEFKNFSKTLRSLDKMTDDIFRTH